MVMLFTACDNTEEAEFAAEGLRPVYIDPGDFSNIYSSSPRPLVETGKIYYYLNYIFIGDAGIGVHVVDNTDPREPVNIAFINIPSNNDIAIQGNVMYADNGRDLVVLDISDPTDVKELNRFDDMYSESIQSYPPFYNGYFECVDTEKGIVIKWEEATLTNPKCRR